MYFQMFTHLAGDVFAEWLLKDAHIAATLGSAFGPGGRLRAADATSQERLREALERIGKMIRR